MNAPLMIGRAAAALVVSCLVASSVAVPAAAEDGAGSRTELRRIKRELLEKKRELQRAKKRERSVLADLEKMDRAIQEGKTDLVVQQRRLLDAETALRDINKSNAQVSDDLGKLKRRYAERLRALYIMKRQGYGLSVLASDSATAALRRVKYLGMIAERNRRLIAEYGTALQELQQRRTQTEARRREILERKQAVAARKASLEERRRGKSELLASIKNQKGLYEDTLRELEESSAGLWAMIQRAEKERRDRQRAKSAVSRETPRPAAVESNRLPWPVEGAVLTRFGAQRHPQFGTMVYRRGIEIAAAAGDAVRAVADGQAVFADWHKGYGKLLIIEHQSGLYTLYGHLSELEAAAGDRVVGGQTVGRAGDTGSLKGTRLYFEIRRNGEAEDPLRWLVKR